MQKFATCPFKIGDKVRFMPNERSKGLYQNVERFGLAIGQVAVIKEIKDDVYLYFDNHIGGWPWNEFVIVDEKTE